MPDQQFDQIWDMHLSMMKAKVAARAKEIAEKDNREEVSVADTIDAIREFIPGGPVAQNSTPAPREPGWWNKNVTGFIGITAILTVVFGLLGLLPYLKESTNTGFNEIAKSFLEVAKIFAGALVGGAAGAAASQVKK